MNNQTLLTIPQFARELGLSEYLTRLLIADRKIETVAIGRRRRVQSEVAKAVVERILDSSRARG